MKAAIGTAAARKAPEAAPFDVERVRADFPILSRLVSGKPLVYLDSAATTQKPQAVIDAIVRYYSESNANVHRGVHKLSVAATELYEGAREKARAFLGAKSTKEILFVRGTTEGVNLVAQSWGRNRLRPQDEVLITGMEHHSNIVPWQMLCEQTGATLRVLPIDDRGDLALDELDRVLTERTKLVAISHISNALGTIAPLEEIVPRAHRVGAIVVVDGAQAAGHMPVDVAAMDCDFYTISGHKMFGPTGIGVLYGKEKLLEAMPPWQGGGDMIKSVSFDLPYKFEAGTPDIAGVVGLGAAIDYLEKIGRRNAACHEAQLLDYGTELLSRVEGLHLIGTSSKKAGVLSFTLDGIHPHDAGTVLDHEGIAVRTGHHCAQPVMTRFEIPATTRASLSIYNRREDLDALIRGLHKVREILG
jgi:cysteine desulfurase/selenocysteine lyase